MSRIVALALLLAAAPSSADEALAVVAVADPPAGPGSELAALTHEVRAACRARAAGVLDLAEMRVRLFGPTPTATVAELESARLAAETALERAEYEAAARALRDVVSGAEAQPASAAAHALWTRALARLAYAEKLLRNAQPSASALDRLVAVEPAFAADPAQYPPSYEKDLEAARRRAAGAKKLELTVSSSGAPADVFVDGRPWGKTPLTVALAAGRHRVTGAIAAARLPLVVVELEREPRAVVLDATAEALRMDAGPGIAASGPERSARALRAGAWMGATRLVAASLLSERGAHLLAAVLYDVQRGTTVREGRVRIEGGTVSPATLGALAGFLLTGQAARDVIAVPPTVDLSLAGAAPGTVVLAAAPPPAPAKVRAWVRPAAYGSGALALGLAGFALYEGIASRNATRAADALVQPDGLLVSASDRALYDGRRADASRHEKVAYASAASAVVFAAAAGVLGYLSRDEQGAPVVRF